MTLSYTPNSCLSRLMVPLALCLVVNVRAQSPLWPTVNTTIVVGVGELHYSSINIPAGVTVRFVAAGGAPGLPAIVRCDGDAIVHGTLSVTGDWSVNDRPAGWVTTGEGSVGNVCGSIYAPPPQGGRHDYGSVLPFSLEGGSPGGELLYWDSPCLQFQYSDPGGRGGGTLVVLANGRVDIHGTVTADGLDSSAGGSGGSILLRGEGGVNIFPSATVTARGGTAPVPPPQFPFGMSTGHDGYIRLDAWGAAPVIQGTVLPPPTVIQLPYLHTRSQPNIGTTWTFEVFAPVNGLVHVAAALAPASSFPTPFGPLGLDLASAVSLGTVFPQLSPNHDPRAFMAWPIPNSSSLVGFAMWLQAISLPQTLAGRLSNTISVVVQ
jgi:hypothetical protein